MKASQKEKAVPVQNIKSCMKLSKAHMSKVKYNSPKNVPAACSLTQLPLNERLTISELELEIKK